MRRLGFGLAAIITVAFGYTPSAAAQGYGVAGYYGGGATWGYDSTDQKYFPGGNQYYPYSVQQIPFYASGSAAGGQAFANLKISATPAHENVALHGYAASGFTYQAGFEFPGNAGAGFDLYAYDTFHIGGAVGTYEQFQYSLTLNGSVSTQTNGDPAASAAYGGIGLFADANWIAAGTIVTGPSCAYSGGSLGIETNGNPCGTAASIYLNKYNPNDQTVTGTLTLVGGSTIQLGEDLWSRVFVGEANTASAEFNAADTGFFTFAPLTPGASFTTDSGLTYSTSPDVGGVPEPATWAMMIVGIGMIGFATRRRSGGVALVA